MAVIITARLLVKGLALGVVRQSVQLNVIWGVLAALENVLQLVLGLVLQLVLGHVLADVRQVVRVVLVDVGRVVVAHVRAVAEQGAEVDAHLHVVVRVLEIALPTVKTIAILHVQAHQCNIAVSARIRVARIVLRLAPQVVRHRVATADVLAIVLARA